MLGTAHEKYPAEKSLRAMRSMRTAFVRRLSTSLSTITYPAKPPNGKHSGRLMDQSVWPKIAPIWPSSMHFPHETSTLQEEDKVVAMPVSNARDIAPTLKTHGFECRKWPTSVDFDKVEVDEEHAKIYLDETRQLVEAATGASFAIPFHHVQIDTQRDNFGKRGGAVERVHGDYTHQSGPRMLSELADRGVIPEKTRSLRGAILNVWRPVLTTPVQDKPLALCDINTVELKDLGIYYLVEGGEGLEQRRMGQNLALHYDPRHRWYYYPEMVRDEALVFYTYDGRVPDTPKFTFHCAFDAHDAREDAPARRAMIVRVAAFFED